MRLTLLAAAILLSLHTCFAAVPALATSPADAMAKPPVKNTTHEKKKGTVGFISGLLLGPVGLGGVYLFTHNHTQRKAATKGCVIFATVVVAAALCWLIVLGAKDIGSSGSGSSSHSGSGSGSGGSVRPGGPGSGAHPSSGGHSSNTNWGNNLNWPGGPSSTPEKKKPAPNQLPADWPSTMLLIY
jgi:uncharacterized membrane protein YgcG